MLRRFFTNKSGNFAILTALMAVPLILAVGFAIDGTRYYSAHSKLQNATDMAALALAASTEQDKQVLASLATSYLMANMSKAYVDDISVETTTATPEEIELVASATMPLTLMRLAGLSHMKIETLTKAMRSPVRNIEIALVLDNTWSMSEKDPNGIQKIDTLKEAARELVSELIVEAEGRVKIGLVPYADYVNVGIGRRNASWLEVGANYSTAPDEQQCETRTSVMACPVTEAPTYSCTVYRDGVPEPSTCGGGCPVAEVSKTVPAYKSCSGGGVAKNFKWYGCVASRKLGASRLNDQASGGRYPGMLDTSQKCLNPIVPLTTNRNKLLLAVDEMVINIRNYKPYTYIPAGLIWGQNILSRSEPFNEAADYDEYNVDPRKVMILMTDGDNTLRFNAGNGRHVGLSTSKQEAVTQARQTDNDTLSICNYSKSKKIEIFTVAFMVGNSTSKAMLEACASSSRHYFDASNRNKLLAAFAGISRAINEVRIAQ